MPAGENRLPPAQNDAQARTGSEEFLMD
ncbi:Protein of unknown function [Escherichia coli]|nr:Protein of unknown function [Escherichia coli]CDU40355.1 Protein of unknown function [Escherichia coli]